MGKKKEQSGSSKTQEIARRLIEDLGKLNAQTQSAPTADNDMLSLVVSETIKGVDIPKRYPTFYQKLLSDPHLRGAFVDLLESFDDENQLAPNLKTAPADLDFLNQQLLEPKLEKITKNKWLVSWMQTVEQLQGIFSPPTLAFRKSLSLIDDHWFVLLREEIAIEGTLYTVDLESIFAEGGNDMLSTFLNLAVTFEADKDISKLPIQATLKWGSYQASILITQEGRARFPDIPFASVFDSALQKVASDLNFSLEITQ